MTISAELKEAMYQDRVIYAVYCYDCGDIVAQSTSDLDIQMYKKDHVQRPGCDGHRVIVTDLDNALDYPS